MGIPWSSLRISPRCLSSSSLLAWEIATSLGHVDVMALSASPSWLWRDIWSRNELTRSSLLSRPSRMSRWYSCAGRWRDVEGDIFSY